MENLEPGVPQPTLPEPTLLTPLPSPQKSSHVLAILITFFITSFILVCSYFAYQYIRSYSLATIASTTDPTSTPTSQPSTTPNPTANWQTYQNTRYGYQLKYPASLSVVEEDGPTDSQLAPNQKIQQVTLSNKSFSLKIYYEGEFDHGFEPWELDKREDSTLGNKPAIKTVLTSPESDNLWIIYTIENFHSFRVEGSTNKSDVKIIDQILSTFKFINSKTDTSVTKVEGYIRKIETSDNRYLITLDQAEWVDTPSAPNGYEIKNPFKDSVVFAIDPKAPIIMQTYSLDANQNNFNFNQKITQDQFAHFIQNLGEQNPFFTLELDPSSQTVTKISERYQP